MNMKPLLTILIPTFNRRKHLEYLLPIMIAQVRAFPDINLIVSNNGSSDDTAEYLKRWENEPRVTVYHQKNNLGLDLHVAWLYAQATGRFLWLYGDDDVLEEDLVGLVVQELRANPDLGFVHLPATYLFTNGTKVQTHCPTSKAEFKRCRELYASYISWIGFMTANVLRAEPLQKKLPRVTFDTAWWMQFLFMANLADLPAVVLPVRKLTSAPDASWTDRGAEIVILQIPKGILNCGGITAAEKTACLRQRYTEQPGELFELMYFSVPLFFRVAFRCPLQVLNIKFFRAVARRLLKPKKAVRTLRS